MVDCWLLCIGLRIVRLILLTRCGGLFVGVITGLLCAVVSAVLLLLRCWLLLLLFPTVVRFVALGVVVQRWLFVLLLLYLYCLITIIYR